jgi:hypothetical protein
VRTVYPSHGLDWRVVLRDLGGLPGGNVVHFPRIVCAAGEYLGAVLNATLVKLNENTTLRPKSFSPDSSKH